jgi:hypothetical protein
MENLVLDSLDHGFVAITVHWFVSSCFYSDELSYGNLIRTQMNQLNTWEFDITMQN